MVKLASILVLIFLTFLSPQHLEASEVPYYCLPGFVGPVPYDCSIYETGDEEPIAFEGIDDYDRIFKRNGIWYGIIDITNTQLSEWNCFNGRCSQSRILLNFSRELERLSSITYDFVEKDSCRGVNLFGFCLGTWVPGESGTHTAFDNPRHGAFTQWVLNSSEIQRAFGSPFDFQIITPLQYGPLESVEVVRFTFVLTNEEVESVLEQMQEQYDSEVQRILTMPGLTDAQRQDRLELLNIEYATFTIEFQEELTSECVGDHCFVDDPSPQFPSFNPIAPIQRLLGEYGQWFLDNLLTSIIFIILGGLFVKALAVAIVNKSFEAIAAIITTLMKALAAGLEVIIRGSFFLLSSILTVFWTGIVSVSNFIFKR